MKNNELLEALTILEREKNISKSTLLEAIESSLLIARGGREGIGGCRVWR